MFYKSGCGLDSAARLHGRLRKQEAGKPKQIKTFDTEIADQDIFEAATEAGESFHRS
jgi:hypothetical protein